MNRFRAVQSLWAFCFAVVAGGAVAAGPQLLKPDGAFAADTAQQPFTPGTVFGADPSPQPSTGSAPGAAASPQPFKPVVGQAGRDAVWVPTPLVLVEKMLDMAKVTPKDYVIDLGSGDGRNVIAAARRGARALGVEFNPDLVEYSKRLAQEQGVADKAQFVQGDMYAADISKATVLALFLLPENLEKLKPKFLALKPGTRIVINAFAIDHWDPDETDFAQGDCSPWCTALLYYVPAQVAGTWRLAQGELALQQNFQKLSGTLTVNGTRVPLANGRMRGHEISFSAGGVHYTGRVSGTTMSGKMKGAASGTWTASKEDPRKQAKVKE